jgi:DNA-binding transcriptional regulator YiaG
MTNDEFAAALRKLGMKQNRFAAKAGVTPEAVNRWCKGGKPVPDWAAWIVELLGENCAQHDRKLGEH